MRPWELLMSIANMLVSLLTPSAMQQMSEIPPLNVYA